MEGLIAWLATDWLGKDIGLWLSTLGLVVALLVFDLGVLGSRRKNREMGVAQSLWLSGFYIGIGLLYGAWIWSRFGAEPGMQYLTGFLVEKTLALDNVFVISLIFTYFAIPRKYQHRVLLWGIIGVLVMRAIMIGLGATLVSQFSWVLYVFGAFLLLTGIKILMAGDKTPKIEENPVLRFMRKRVPITNQLHGERFWVRLPDAHTGKLAWVATPLFVALVLVEVADLIFAVDSVPAIFAITQDPFIVYTSNIFAILGLRALYFALAAMVHRFKYLKYALSLVLIFIGGKIFYNQLFGKLDPSISLGITLGILTAGVLFSLYKTQKQPVA